MTIICLRMSHDPRVSMTEIVGRPTNEILDVCISFLNDHLEETLGSTKIEENHSKCIDLTQVSVSS